MASSSIKIDGTAREDDLQAAEIGAACRGLEPRHLLLEQQDGLAPEVKAVRLRADSLVRTILGVVEEMSPGGDDDTVERAAGMVNRAFAAMLARSVHHDGWRRAELTLLVEAFAGHADLDQSVEWLIGYCRMLYPSRDFPRELAQETLRSFRRGPGHPRSNRPRVRPRKECMSDLFAAAGLEPVEPNNVARVSAVRSRMYGG